MSQEQVLFGRIGIEQLHANDLMRTHQHTFTALNANILIPKRGESPARYCVFASVVGRIGAVSRHGTLPAKNHPHARSYVPSPIGQTQEHTRELLARVQTCSSLFVALPPRASGLQQHRLPHCSCRQPPDRACYTISPAILMLSMASLRLSNGFAGNLLHQAKKHVCMMVLMRRPNRTSAAKA